MTKMKADRDFFRADGISLAKSLLGCTLVHTTEEGTAGGIIVETEAYMGECDAASHSYKRREPDGRTSIQYGDGGFAYIYLIYGMHHCMNIVASLPGNPQSVLIRALQPVLGIDLMQKRRKQQKLTSLCSGPGKLCAALSITRAQYGIDLCGKQLYVERPAAAHGFEIAASPRINVGYSGEAAAYPWRFTIKDSPYVSVKPRLT